MPEQRGGYAEEPGAALESAFRRIEAGRMREVPILNPALAVRAVGFRRHDAGWLGVLVTPWFMNLLLLPASGVPWVSLGEGEKRTMAFPAGAFEFIGGHEEAIGEYQSCSLFSPVLEFEDQQAAIATAEAAIASLFEPAIDGAPQREVAAGRAREPLAARPMTKRDFLRGGLLPRGPS